MAALLTIAAVTALAVSPQCGAVKTDTRFGRDLLRRIVATAQGESGLDPYVIHINKAGEAARHYKTEIDAIVGALELDAAGVDYDAGLMQINRRQFDRHKLTLQVGSIFDPCQNVRAGADHLTGDVSAVMNLASRRYNCGHTDCGEAYAKHIDELAARVNIGAVSVAEDADAAPATPVDKPPPSWNVWATEVWRRHRAGMDNPQETK